MAAELVADESGRPPHLARGERAARRAAPTDFAPILVGEIELGAGLGAMHAVTGDAGRDAGHEALVLVRLHGAPLGLVRLDLSVADRRRAWTDAVADAFGPEIAAHLRRDTASSAALDLWRGVPLHRPSCQEHRRRTHARGRPATIVVATRERPESLERCLSSLSGLDYPEFEIVVVDNDPETDAAAEVVRRFAERGRVRYVRENTRGLGVAHNAGLEQARGEIVAFTDDDVIVDPHWLTELVAPFADDSAVAGATGLVLPAELATPAQLLLECHARFAKGFAPRDFDLGEHRPADPFFPFAAGQLGSGANMAFEMEHLRRLGGFDAALGVGSPARGGDDLAALYDVVASGRRLAYRPGAIVWHHHHRALAALARQSYGYGVGFGAYIASISWHDPSRIMPMLARLPRALASVAGTSARPAVERAEITGALGRAPQWPRTLSGLQLQGLLVGPLAYARSRLATSAGRRAPSRM